MWKREFLWTYWNEAINLWGRRISLAWGGMDSRVNLKRKSRNLRVLTDIDSLEIDKKIRFSYEIILMLKAATLEIVRRCRSSRDCVTTEKLSLPASCCDCLIRNIFSTRARLDIEIVTHTIANLRHSRDTSSGSSHSFLRGGRWRFKFQIRRLLRWDDE